jgi:hypothetical protein
MLETERGGTISSLYRTRFGRVYRPVVKPDCGMNGEVTLDPQFLNSLANEIGITRSGCG